jgi:hypothetical protein
MPHYFLHQRTETGLIPDEEGQGYPNLETAKEDAIDAARELMSEKVLEGIAPNGSQFEITDEAGTIVAIVPFKSALRDK